MLPQDHRSASDMSLLSHSSYSLRCSKQTCFCNALLAVFWTLARLCRTGNAVLSSWTHREMVKCLGPRFFLVLPRLVYSWRKVLPSKPPRWRSLLIVSLSFFLFFFCFPSLWELLASSPCPRPHQVICHCLMESHSCQTQGVTSEKSFAGNDPHL